MISHDVTVIYELKTIRVIKTVKGAFGSSLLFQNSEHPKIDYFGNNKLSFNQLNMFLDTNKNILVLVGLTKKGLGRSM